jgi:hypothetical protein
MQAVAQLVGVDVALGPAPARDDDAGGGDARQAGEADELPGHTGHGA